MLIALAGFQIHLYKKLWKQLQHHNFSRFSINTLENRNQWLQESCSSYFKLVKVFSFSYLLSVPLQCRTNMMWMSEPQCRSCKTKMHDSRTTCWKSTRSNTDHVSAQTSPKEGRPRGLQGQAMRRDRALTYARVEQTTTDTFLPLLTFETILKMAVT